MRFYMPVSLLFIGSLFFNAIWASDVEVQIEEGIKLHDSGNYDKAISKFNTALEIEPENVEAMYELANTYFAKGDFDSCIATAQSGVENPSYLEVALYTAAGSCYSASGNTEKALEKFRAGLERDPTDPNLNFNIAITLINTGELITAEKHLENAIDGSPSYASPYFVLGELHRRNGHRSQSLFYFTRFVTIEPNSSRSAQASSSVYTLLSSGITKEYGESPKVKIPRSEKGDVFSALEFALSMSGLRIYVDEPTEQNSEADRNVSGLLSFFQLTEELSKPDENKKLLDTAVWKQAISPILELHKRRGSEALAYVMAEKTLISGATTWTRQNRRKIDELITLLNE
jgi:tetratricopeptide (TPR) repeat protein